MSEPLPVSGGTRLARLLAIGAAAVLAVLLPIGIAVPASAHDQVVSTSPAEGEHRDVAPTEVSMTFTSAILEIGAIMLVVEAGGEGIFPEKHAARFQGGSLGVLQGTRSYILQDEFGQIQLTHSVSAV